MVNYFAIVVLQASLALGTSSDFLDSLSFSSIDFSQNFVHSLEIKKGGGGSGHTKNTRSSTKAKHEKGDARRDADQKRSNNPNKKR